MVSIGILFALISMICWGISDFTIKKLTNKYDSITTMFFKIIPHMFLIFCFFVFFGFYIPNDPKVLLLLLIYGLVGGVGFYYFVLSIENGMVSLSVPIAHGYIIITAILSSFFLNEVLGVHKYVFILVMLFGIFLLSMDPKDIMHFKFSKFTISAKYAVVTMFCWGVIYFIMKLIVVQIGTIPTTFYTDLGVFIFIFILFIRNYLKTKNTNFNDSKFNKTEIKYNLIDIKSNQTEINYNQTEKESKQSTIESGSKNYIIKGLLTTNFKKRIPLIIFSGLSSAIATIFMVLSISFEMVTLSMGIICAAPFVTFVLAYIFLKERITLIQMIAIILIVVCLIVLST